MHSTKIKKMSVYPTLDTTQQVIDIVKANLSKDRKNEVIGLLYTYHNTLLKELNHVTSN